ncbi:MAG: response regulator, partial [Verrucomicrobiota bacterium]
HEDVSIEFGGSDFLIAFYRERLKVGATEFDAHILVVEDEKMTQSVIEHGLGRVGFKVTVAASAEEALELVADEGGPFDLLLTDMVLPGKSGLELAADLRATGFDKPVIYTTGYPDLPPEMRPDEEDANLLAKPFRLDELKPMIEHALGASCVSRT